MTGSDVDTGSEWHANECTHPAVAVRVAGELAEAALGFAVTRAGVTVLPVRAALR